MRKSAGWMVLCDDRILEYIREKDSGSPKEMEDSDLVRFSSQYIGQRCKILEKHGLLKHLGNGVYVITDEAKRYLDGQLDTRDLNEGSG